MTEPRHSKSIGAPENAPTESSGTDRQSDGQRRPYEAPRMSTGDIFERIVMSSHVSPNAEDC